MRFHADDSISPFQPWDEKDFKFPGGVGIFNPAFVMTIARATAMRHANAGDNLNGPLAILSAVYEGSQLPMDTALRLESKYFAKLVADPQAGAMVRSLFVSKQAAEKGARRPQGEPAMPPRKIGVLARYDGSRHCHGDRAGRNRGHAAGLRNDFIREWQGLYRRASGEAADGRSAGKRDLEPPSADHRLCRS